MESWMVFVIGAVAFVIIVYVISLISGSTSKQVKEQQEEQHKEHLKALTKELNELKEEKVSSFVRVKALLEGATDGLVGGKDALRTTCTERNLVEDGKAAALAQRNVLTPHGRDGVGVLHGLVVFDFDLGARLLVAEF